MDFVNDPFIRPSLKLLLLSDCSCSSRLSGGCLCGGPGNKSLFPQVLHPINIDSLMFVEVKESDPISLQSPLKNNYIKDNSTACSDTIFDFGVQNLARVSFGTHDNKMMTGETTNLEETLSNNKFEAGLNYVHGMSQNEEDDRFY